MTENAYTFINLEYMDMMSEGDPEMKKVMLGMLLEELPTEIEKMGPLCDQANWNDLASVSHKMKSTLAFVGNAAMTESNKEIELICKNGGDTSRIPGLLQTLNSSVTPVMSELTTEFERL